MLFGKILLVLLSICFIVNAQDSIGDSCHHKEKNSAGLCVLIKYCQSALADISKRKNPQLCGFQGLVPIACCPDNDPDVQIMTEAPKPPKPVRKPGEIADQSDKCNVAVNITGTCKLLQNCPRAVIQKELNKPLLYCGEENKENPLVCCPNIGDITEQQCVVYGKEVFVYRSPVLLLINSPRVLTSTCVNEGTTFVSSGVNAKPKEFPHMALLGYGQEDNRAWVCGGALISKQYVLTAAHCSYHRVSGTTVKWVRLGELNKVEEIDTHREDFNVKEFIKYPLYKVGIKYHDIALILLDREVTFSENIRPACLNTIPSFPIEKKMIATGWGSLGNDKGLANVLQKVALQQYATNECQKSYNDSSSLKNLPSGITDALICAGDKTEAKDTCGGDSGGPLQIYHDKVYCMLSVTGVTAFGRKFCGQPGVPGVYTKVSNYIEWIENIVWV